MKSAPGAEHALSGRALRAFNATLQSLPNLDYPFHDKIVTVTTCGRICFNRQKINQAPRARAQGIPRRSIHTDLTWQDGL
jgi:hypothetical protein